MAAAAKVRKYRTSRALASSVSRTLAKGGHKRNEWLASGRVRGWGNSTGGFEVTGRREDYGPGERGPKTRMLDTMTCTVKHITSSWDRDDEDREMVYARYAETLREAGFNVEKSRADNAAGLIEGLFVWMPSVSA